MRRGFLKYALGLALSIASPVHAGGPLSVCSGVPTKYAGAGSVTLNYDLGNLGSRSKAQADALVTEAVSLWTNVGTATVTLARGSDLPVDVTTANYLTYIGGSTYGDGLNPVVYDTDGSIIDTMLGVGAKNSVLGFAGSAWYVYPSYCQYAEGRAVINGYIAIDDTTMKTVLAHEVGHLIGLDHTQIDSSQGLSSTYPSNYPLMYPIAYRDYVSLHEDDVAAVSALYPDATLSSVYGQLTGTFTLADGVTPVRGANLWARETTGSNLYSIVSDYLMQNTGYFKLLLPAGTYTLHAEAVRTSFTGGSSVGPYSETLSDPSFQAPLYVGGVAMTSVTLGNATPTQIVITPGCTATFSFKFDGTGAGTGCASCVAGADTDMDGIPDCVELIELRNPLVKDNDIFTVDRLFAMQQYRDFLSREGDSGGIATWTNYITSGAYTRAQVIDSFFNSPEFGGVVPPVVRLYFAYFLRIPDYGGLMYWLGQYRAGLPLASISNSFSAAPEFVARYGSLNNGQFVTLVYSNVLGRAPDPTGYAYWLEQLDTGAMTRGQVMLGFSESAEYQARIYNSVYVTMMYVGMLRRSPEQAGFDAWVANLNAGMSGLNLINGFIAAPEYHGRFL